MEGMILIADAIDRIAGDRYQRLSDAERIEIDDVLYAADDYVNGRMPLEVFASIGTIESPHTRKPSSGYTRYLAMLSTPIADPRRMALRKAIDGLLRLQGLVITTAGVFEPGEIVDVPIHRAPDPWYAGSEAA